MRQGKIILEASHRASPPHRTCPPLPIAGDEAVELPLAPLARLGNFLVNSNGRSSREAGSPIASENAAQSMEHGAVRITYPPDLPPEQIDSLRDLPRQQSYILVSPFPDLPSPVVVSAWGRQLHLD